MKGVSLHDVFDPPCGGLGKESGTEVQSRNLSIRSGILQCQRDVTRSASKIKDRGGLALGDSFHEAFPPKNIQPEAENAVIAVVGGGELGKKGLNPRGVIGRIQLAVDLAGVLGVVVAKVRAS